MTETAPADTALGGLHPAVREAAVRLAVELCDRAPLEQKEIPDRSQLNTLLRAAQGTPSVCEVILFVRYQATRQREKEGSFLAGVADALEGVQWARDIEAIRFFLGSLVRAGHVATQRRRQRARDTGGGGGRG
jgi:hypothetical protein